jgi:PKD repeat protein
MGLDLVIDERLAVTFTNATSGTATYLWTFGDGATSTLTHPAHTYTSGGVYTVSLTAQGPGGSDTLTEPSYITVTSAVTAEFSGTPLSGNAPLTVTFTNLSSGASAYERAFDDGASGSTATHTAHTYTQPGSFTVVLTATAGSESDSETEVDYVTVSAAALASGAQSVPPIRGLQWLGAEDEDMIGRHQVPSLDPAIHTRYTSNAD